MTQPMMAAPRAVRDPLRQLLEDLQNDRVRLRQMRDPTPQKLSLELNDTLIPYLGDVVAHTLAVRDEVHKLHQWLQHIVPDVDARLDALEAGEPVGLDDETLILLVEIVGKCRAFAASALSQSPHIDKAAAAEMTELCQKCDRAIELLDEMGSEEEQDDDGDDEPQDDEPAEEASS